VRRLAFVVLVVATGSFAGGTPAGISSNTAIYEDERGEEADAPDIATVSVSIDDSN